MVFYQRPLWLVAFSLLLLSQHVSAQCVNVLNDPINGIEKQLEQEIESYYSLIEESLHHRVISLELFAQLNAELESDGHLSAASLLRFKQAIKAHLDLRQRLYAVARSRECWLDHDYDGLNKKLRLKGIMFSLSAALTLYDNYLLVIAMFQDNDQLRRIIDQPDMGFGLSSNHLLDASLAFHSVINREKVNYAIKFYQRHSNASDLSTHNSINLSNDFLYLNSLIVQSPSYKILQKHSPLSFLQKKITFYTIATNDSLVKLEKEGIHLLSLFFGNAIGMVESRKGKLYHHPKVRSELLKSLRAGDILLEKTPFRLTDQFIPGYWGHAAIWIGNEQELKTLGIWDHDIVKPWQKSIRKGHSIVEALRSGVKLDPLVTFMNIDDMVILRDTTISSEQLRQTILNAFRQLGKAYDFNFDISTSDKIVCSELVYLSYSYIDWPTEKTLGRYTISPDHIALKAKNKQLSIIQLYLNGQRVSSDKLSKQFSRLLSSEH